MNAGLLRCVHGRNSNPTGKGINYFVGRAIAQAVSPWLPTAEGRVQTRV
jgi:hypothetical protein